MNQQPIKELVQIAMESIKEMIDVNTIVGDPLETNNGTIIMPVSRVTFGFVSGGTEFSNTGVKGQKQSEEDGDNSSASKYPFGGGSGAGVSIEPVAFMVVEEGNVKLLPVSQKNNMERMLEMMPEVLDKVNPFREEVGIKKSKEKKKAPKQEESSSRTPSRNSNREEGSKIFRSIKSEDTDDEMMD